MGIPENNLPIANAAEWELKAQRSKSSSLLTLFHMEPSPSVLKIVPNILLQGFGWRHQKAGINYPENERSFRATIHATTYSDRGLTVNVNDKERKVEVLFDERKVGENHSEWLQNVLSWKQKSEYTQIVPYWGFDDLFHKAAIKLHNCFYVMADEKRERINGKTKSYFLYNYVLKLSECDEEKFIDAIRMGKIYIDFDARTGHNHGTKFRIKPSDVPNLYKNAEIIIDGRSRNNGDI